MRKVVAYELLSVDGVAEGPDAFVTDFDEVMGENLDRVISAQDTVLLGRRTYDEWAGFWPASEIEPFATFINNVQKFVATSSPLEREWANTAVVEGALADFVTELKHQPGNDIGVHGSVSLAHSLFEASLIDELRLVIAPAVQMQGRKLFAKGVPRRLSLTHCVTSPAGYLLVDFEIRN